MAHFTIDYSDFDDQNKLFQSIAKNQKNPITNTPLTTSGSKSGDPQSITTVSMSDTYQAVPLYRSKAFLIDAQETALTRAFRGYIDKEKGGGSPSSAVSTGTRPFVSPSIRSLVGETSSSFESIQRLNAGISDTTINGAGSGVVGDSYKGAPETDKLHALVEGGGNEIDDIPGVWRTVGRLKDSELIPPDYEGMDNGRIDSSILTTFSNRNTTNQPRTPENRRLWSTAAAAVIQLMDAAENDGFTGPFIIDAYRSWDVQNNAYNRAEAVDPVTGEFVNPDKQGLVNKPGTSMHGWGFAVDWHSHFLYQKATNGDVHSNRVSGIEWLYLNSYKFGIVHPEWALPAGFHTEPWHWEYRGHVYKYFLDGNNIPR